MNPSQLSLFGPRDAVAELALSYMELAWDILQARSLLTDAGVAELRGERALTQQKLETLTDKRLAVPAVAEIRDRYRRRHAERQPAPEHPPVHFRGAAPAWARRREGSDT